MDDRQLRHFLALMEHGNYGRAAESLGITRQGLSQSITGLEDQLGVKLFDRGRSGAEPTEFGLAFEPHASLMQAQARQARAAVETLKSQHKGELTVALGPSFSDSIGTGALQKYHEQHPDVSIRVFRDHPDVFLEMLRRGEIDFAAAAIYADQSMTPELKAEPLFSVQNTVLCAASHPLAGRSPIDLKDLEPYSWVVPWKTDRTRRFIAEKMRQGGVTAPVDFMHSNDIGITRSFVLRYDYLFYANRFFLDFEVSQGLVTELDIPELAQTATASLITRKQSVLSRAADGLIETFREHSIAEANRKKQTAAA